MFFSENIPYSPREVLVYLRKSRSDQPDLTVEEVLAKHEAILDDWSARYLGGTVPQKNKYREVVSGETIADRPQMKEVLRRIEDPRVKAVLVVEVQRISRGDLEDAGRLLKLFRYTNTVVITPQQTFDLQNEYDRDFFERELKRGNEFLEYQKKIMSRGRLLSVQQGNYVGSRAPYGYLPDVIMDGKRKCPTLKIDPDRAPIVQMIFELFVNQGLGPTLICHRLNALGVAPYSGKSWTPSCIYPILHNIHYTGRVSWNRRKSVSVVEDSCIFKTRPRHIEGDYLVFPGKHPAIISDELFEAAQAKNPGTTPTNASSPLRNAFAGLIFCQCGHAMTMRTYLSHGVERCPPRLLCNCQSFCHTSSCRYEEMVEEISSVLRLHIHDCQLLLQKSNQQALAAAHAAIVTQLEERLRALEQKEITQWEKYTEEAMPKEIFKKLNAAVVKEKEEARIALKQARASTPTPVDYAQKIARLQDALAALEDPQAPASEKNRLLKLCIDRIDYDRPPIQRGSGTTAHGGWEADPFQLTVKFKI